MSGGELPLAAGGVRLDGDGADLRGLAVGGGAVLVQRIYPAFRDWDWRSAPVVVRRRELRAGAREFELELEGTARLGTLDVGWSAVARGAADGTVSYLLDVEACATFLARRIGLCVHLDADACVGARARAGGAGRRAETLALGEAIQPQPLRGGDFVAILGPFTRLEVEHADGARTRVETGETAFELEDQRNWGDASYKAYVAGPPAGVRFAPGDRVRQEVRVRLRAGAARRPPAPRAAAADVVVEPAAGRVVPPIGVGELRGPLPAGLAPAHLRLDVRLGQRTPPPDLAHVEAVVARSGAAVELAVHGRVEDRPTLPAAVRALPLARVLALDAGERTTTLALARHVRRAVGPGPELVVGTPANFSEICRRPPARSGPRAVCWSACPQVHAVDDRSVIENLPALGAQVRSVPALGAGLRAHVSLLRLAPPGVEDPRARSPFGAAWAVGALAQLLAQDVASITIAAGARRSTVLAAVAELMAAQGAALRPVATPSARLAAVAWGDGPGTLLLANLSPQPRRVAVRGHAELELGPWATVRLAAREG